VTESDDIWAEHAELVGLLQSEESFADTLDRVAKLACAAIPGCSSGSVTLWTDGKPYTVVSTDELALEVDRAQYETLEGPCLDASRYGETYASADLTTDGRWPAWASLAVARGIRSSLSLPLVVRGLPIGALNLYSLELDGFAAAVEAGQLFAAQAGVAIANAEVYQTSRTLVAQMEEALQARAIVEQAKGILMAERDCSAEEAFEVLRTEAQREDAKLHDVAARIVHTRTQPG
jgi:GAF domain-containing protein